LERIWRLSAFFSFCLIIASAGVSLWIWEQSQAQGMSYSKAGESWSGQVPSSWPSLNLQEQSSGIINPVHIDHAGDDSGRLFVVAQAGQVHIIRNGNLLPAPFLDIRSRVACCGERGLFSTAFPPEYSTKGYFYVHYTNLEGNTVIARYGISLNPDLADPNSEVIILTLTQPYANHNGGQMAFGPDGYLYIGLGDGGSGGDPQKNAQNPEVLLGKILRIDVEGVGCVSTPPRTPKNYCIPQSNPMVDTASAQPEIWATGLRNPWRFSFDRMSGDLYIADVGQGGWEEVNHQPGFSQGGDNYGWNIFEGTHCFLPSTGCVAPERYVAPVAEYQNRVVGCSVTGGFVYRGPVFSTMQGIYFYADFCTGKIFGLRNDNGWENQQLFEAPFTISTFGEDQDGFLYLADYSNGVIYRIQSVIVPGDLPFSFYLPIMSK
jgi:glucose/arabinose dehydrogenase